MKNNTEFLKFLEDEVNLNQTRIGTLRDRVNVVSTFVSSCDWPASVQRFSAQGSWAHKTIIKPPGDGGFDADLLVFVTPMPNWNPSDYLLTLRTAMWNSELYKDKAGLRTRCVTVEYANDFTIDLVPCLVNRSGGTYRLEVCNRKTGQFEPTDSELYTAWWEERNIWVGNNQLREVTRLLKYLRDIKFTFTCKSILLTTLLGNRISTSDIIYRQTLFSDLPSSLQTLVGRLDDYLQSQPALHDVVNPVLPSETFIRHWDDDRYSNFRDMIHKYRGWIDDAFDEPDADESLNKWQRVFGDQFGGASGRALIKISESAVTATSIGIPYADSVAAVKTVGKRLLASVVPFVSWMKSPPWRAVGGSTAIIHGTIHGDRSGTAQLGNLESGEVVQKNLHLRFEVFGANHFSYAANKQLFDVQWQVVNTDVAASRAGGLRGGFYPSATPAVRWESTLYHGIHWVQAFVIRRRDRACVARSDRFFVVID